MSPLPLLVTSAHAAFSWPISLPPLNFGEPFFFFRSRSFSPHCLPNFLYCRCQHSSIFPLFIQILNITFSQPRPSTILFFAPSNRLSLSIASVPSRLSLFCTRGSAQMRSNPPFFSPPLQLKLPLISAMIHPYTRPPSLFFLTPPLPRFVPATAILLFPFPFLIPSPLLPIYQLPFSGVTLPPPTRY